MFNSKEVSMLTLDYFKLKMCVSDVCELESQNGDHWIILKKQTRLTKKQIHNTRNRSYTFLIFHRHSNDDGFHFQTETNSTLDAILEIINHDDFRLKRKGKTYFDYVNARFS